MDFAVAAPWTNLPQGIVLGIVLGWTPIGFAVMATPRPSQYYFGRTIYICISIHEFKDTYKYLCINPSVADWFTKQT